MRSRERAPTRGTPTRWRARLSTDQAGLSRKQLVLRHYVCSLGILGTIFSAIFSKFGEYPWRSNLKNLSRSMVQFVTRNTERYAPIDLTTTSAGLIYLPQMGQIYSLCLLMLSSAVSSDSGSESTAGSVSCERVAGAIGPRHACEGTGIA